MAGKTALHVQLVAAAGGCNGCIGAKNAPLVRELFNNNKRKYKEFQERLIYFKAKRGYRCLMWDLIHEQWYLTENNYKTVGPDGAFLKML